MRTRNGLNLSGAITVGAKSANVSGSRGIVIRDGSVEASPVRDITFLGATVTDNDDGTAVVAISESSLSGTINVKDPIYGAAGDGTTDDTDEINAAIVAFNTAGGGILYFPRGTYKVTAALTTITAPGLVLGDGGAVYDPATRINQTSTTANLFTVSGDGLSFRGMYLANTSAGATTSDGIAVTDGGFALYEDLTIASFRDCISLTGNSRYWNLRGPMYLEALRYDLHVVNTTNPDAGDWEIGPGIVFGYGAAGVVGIYLENAGGGRIIGNKINAANLLTTIGIQMEINGTDATGTLIIDGNSIENTRSEAIKVTTADTATFHSVVIVGNQFGAYGLVLKPAITFSAATLGNLGRCVIAGNTAHADANVDYPFIAMTNVDGVRLSANFHEGFKNYYIETTCTDVVDEAAQVSSSGGGRLLLDDTHSSPIVFGDILQADDHEDFLYADA